ncbi:hypothetical protein Cgig2_032411 [Carnegiea gigantea]|uniref:Fe2OG dioxygenase domain-containing protein n=1 Tax=Carnegiea gigantea TaxID=171969 RepID=A0A9Q1KXU4_9CARY|nr:hypothetical protein Cgig2_032411 [Carnegiea gigantea]
MAGTSSPIPHETAHSYAAATDHNSILKSIKEVAESPNLLSNIPSNYAYFSKPAASAVRADNTDCDSIPVIDFSLLQSASSDQRSKVIRDLGDACQCWGFFMVVNHGVPKILMESMLDKCDEFFNLTPEEKLQFEGKHVLDPIRCGTSFNTSVEEVNFWRDYLKVMVHPIFHSPSKPRGFRRWRWDDFADELPVDVLKRIAAIKVYPNLEDIEYRTHVLRSCIAVWEVWNYIKPARHGTHDLRLGFQEWFIGNIQQTTIRHVARVLLRGISASLGLDELQIERSMDWEMGQQILVANYYPPCPRPDLAIGMPPHSDHGLLTILAQNQVDGLQIQHNGKWVPVHASPNSFLVNTGDHIEIFSNGIYRSVLHRAVVNSRETRISLAIANGPSLNAMVTPAPQLIDKNRDSTGARYKSMAYGEYVQLQQSSRLNGKSALDNLRV